MRPRRLLILTAQASLAEVLQDRFRAMGLAALAAPPAEAARVLAHWDRPDAVIWDLDGAPPENPEALRRRLQSPPLMLALAAPGPGEPPAGFDAALARPLDFEDLAMALQLRLAELPEQAGRAPRIPIRPLPAEVARAGRSPRLDRQGVRVLNMDLAGCGFQSLEDFQEGAEITLWLPVPGEAKRLSLQATVRWCRREGGKARVGCQFATVSPADLERLERILEARKP